MCVCVGSRQKLSIATTVGVKLVLRLMDAAVLGFATSFFGVFGHRIARAAGKLCTVQHSNIELVVWQRNTVGSSLGREEGSRGIKT